MIITTAGKVEACWVDGERGLSRKGKGKPRGADIQFRVLLYSCIALLHKLLVGPSILRPFSVSSISVQFVIPLPPNRIRIHHSIAPKNPTNTLEGRHESCPTSLSNCGVEISSRLRSSLPVRHKLASCPSPSSPIYMQP